MPEQTTELSLADRAKKAIALQQTDAELQELAAKSADIGEIKSAADYALVKRSSIVLRDTRIVIEKAGKLARDDANNFRDAVLTEQKRLIDIISPEENRLKALRKVEDGKVAAAAEEKRIAEEARVQKLRAKVAAINNMAHMPLSASAEAIQQRIDQCKDILITKESFADYTEAASAAFAETMSTLDELLADRVEFEHRRAEQQRIAAEQANKQAELDRQAEQQAEARRIGDERIAKEQQRIEDQQAAIDAENKRIADEAQAKKDAQAQADRDARDKLEEEKRNREYAEQAEADRLAEEARQEALKPAKERLLNWINTLKFDGRITLTDDGLCAIEGDALCAVEEILIDLRARVEAL